MPDKAPASPPPPPKDESELGLAKQRILGQLCKSDRDVLTDGICTLLAGFLSRIYKLERRQRYMEDKFSLEYPKELM